jgi:hypothetical protein
LEPGRKKGILKDLAMINAYSAQIGHSIRSKAAGGNRSEATLEFFS